MSNNTSDFNVLLTACKSLSNMFEDGLVYIGGIAVYLHSMNQVSTAPLAESTHDADFYISFSDMADLRDLEEVTPNRRLQKSQFIKKGFEFDVYTERLSSLIVPYDEVLANSTQYDNMRVACLEHLFVLKLEAYRDRKDSAKGGKDARDLIRLCVVASLTSGFNRELVMPYLDDPHFELFDRLRKSPEAITLAHGNAMHAKSIRKDVQALLGLIENNVSPAKTKPRTATTRHGDTPSPI